MQNAYFGNGSDDEDKSLGSFQFDSSNSNELGSDDVSSDLTMSRRTGGSTTKLARTEHTFVLCSKFLAYLVLFLTAAAAGFFAHHSTRNQENSELEHDVRTKSYRGRGEIALQTIHMQV